MHTTPLLRSALVAVAVLGLAFVAGRAIAQQPHPGEPHMPSALNALWNAHNELNQADRDKGGYRTRAQNLVTEAINEVQAGIAFGGGA